MNSRTLVFPALVFVILLSFQSLAEEKRRVVVVANSIDGAAAKEFYDFLETAGLSVIQLNATEFPNYTAEKFILILGGHNTPEGVGEIVATLLNETEKESLLSSNTSRAMFVKENVWADAQVVRVLAGYEKEETVLSCMENREYVVYALGGTQTTVVTTTVLDLNTCDGYCRDAGYASGVCRMNPYECRIYGEGEVHKKLGDRFCRYRTGHQVTCCCVVNKTD